MSLINSTLHRSAAELLACATLNLFPSAKLVRGGTTDIGFYYEFAFTQPFDRQALALLEETLLRLIKQRLPIKSAEMMRENAVTLFQHLGQELLADQVAKDPCNIVGIFQVGEYQGYSSLPYIENTSAIGGCKLVECLTRSEQTVEVTRIEGVAFEDAKSLKRFLKKYEAAKKVDHRKLGPELELFCHQEIATLGCYSWLPKGEFLRQLLLDFLRREHKKRGYNLVSTPRLLSSVRKASPKPVYFELEGERLYQSSDLLPFHLQLFQSKILSCREFPYRVAEVAEALSTVDSKGLNGLFRTRCFTKDEAHCVCSEEDSLGEVISSLQFIRKTINMFGVDCKWYLVSNRPKLTANKEDWDHGIRLLTKAVKQFDQGDIVNSDEIAANGPKIEGRYIDSLGREWPGPSLRICCVEPDLECHYRSSSGKSRRAVVIAWSLFGSVERFIGGLLENLAGIFPLWLAPEQVRIIPVKENHREYAESVRKQLRGIRVSVDNSSEPLAAKVYAAKRTKVPYAAIVGNSEQHNGTIAISPFQGRGKGKTEKPQVFLKALQEEIAQCPFSLPEGTQFGDMRSFENK